MRSHYKPAGVCIYCGDTTPPLSREHIIPLSLGGTLVLPRASCSKHRDITSKIEGKVARQFYGTYRDTLRIQTRHRATQRQRSIQSATLDGTLFNGSPCKINVPLRELPRLHLSVLLPRPQLFSGVSFTEGSFGSTVTAVFDETATQRLLDKHHLKTMIFYSDPIQIEIFLRVLAKIAHAFASAEYGVSGFTPTLLPIINGQSNLLLKYIGCDNPESILSSEPLMIDEIEHKGVVYLLVHISLHAFPKLPRYSVIAGRLLNDSALNPEKRTVEN